MTFTSPWNIVGGSRIGPTHERASLPNQDAYGYRSHEEEFFLAVADGAGSLKNSHLGARLAVVASLGSLTGTRHRELTPQERLERAVERASETLTGHELKETIGCTLTLALVTEQGWSVGGVGDSFAVTVENGELGIARGKASEYANITKLLTSSNTTPYFTSGTEPLDSVAVASDGLQYAGLERGNPAPGFWLPLFTRVRSNDLPVEEFFDFLEAGEKIQDDTTFLMASRESVRG